MALTLLMPACTRAAGARLQARPGSAKGSTKPGTHPLNLRKERDTLLYVPTKLRDPAPLVIYLHGATGNEQQGIRRMGKFADEFGFLLLSPASQDYTWESIRGDYGPDVKIIDQGLTRVFAENAVDPAKIAVCGFSDGASVALGLGLSNGDLLRTILAFSPGFIPSGAEKNGKPRIFISHGDRDEVLPIDQCSRRIVPDLKRQGYNVEYKEFSGPHTVPPETAHDAFAWFLS